MIEQLLDIFKGFFDKLSAPVPPCAPPSPPEPPKPPVKWVTSPHFSSRKGKKVQVIILHHTGSLSVKSAISWFQTSTSMVSAHYIVDRDGSITQMVKEEDKAWHAGDSLWNGNKNVNAISMGIEIVGDGTTIFTKEQYDSVVYLCKDIKKRYSLGLSKDVITSHAAIAQPIGRKNDPAPFDWQRFFTQLDK